MNANYGSMAAGYNAYTSHGFSTALGNETVAYEKSMAAGFASYARAESVALGVNAFAKDRSEAIGQYARADQEAIAIGYKATAGGFNKDEQTDKIPQAMTGIAIGKEAYAKGGMAFGNGAESLSLNAMAFGVRAKATGSGIALGYQAQANVSGGIAIGMNSRAEVGRGIKGYLAPGDIDNQTAAEKRTWISGGSAVSFGNIKLTRQLMNVAAGLEDTDAVNVAQLKKVQEIAAAKTTIEAGDNITVAPGTTAGSYKISATDTTLQKGNNALSLDDSKLNLSIKDTAGNEVKGSVDLNAIKSAVDTNTYTTGGTYDAANKKLVFTQSDPDKNYEVDVSAMISDVVDTNTTYTMTGTKNAADNTTTISLKGSDGKEQTVTVATKDTNTYTIGGKYDAATKTIKFTRSDNATYDVDISDAVSNVTDTRNTIVDSDTVTVEAKAQADGSNEYKLNVKTDGKVEKDNKGIVTGGTVYNETRIEKDGNYIKVENTAGQNLTALDKQVGVNSTNITKLENNIYDMGTRVGELDNRMNRVGAGAAALAALHPLDFDPEDKWDFAAGYGNYKGANAAAIGAYYRPNEDTMFSIGGSFGGGENMVNAGVSVKLGRGSEYMKLSRAEMAQKLEEQSKEIREMKAKDKERDAQMQEIMRQLELLQKQAGK